VSGYPSASLTADLLVVAQGQIMLIRRKGAPFRDHWAFPGGFIDAHNDHRGETPEVAALRELQEETGVVLTAEELTLLEVVATPGRDPRGRVVTWAYHAQLLSKPKVRPGDDASDVAWFTLGQATHTHLAFDHSAILARHLEWLSGPYFV
jgi:8-oxo-dGTP diphosphatase